MHDTEKMLLPRVYVEPVSHVLQYQKLSIVHGKYPRCVTTAGPGKPFETACRCTRNSCVNNAQCDQLHLLVFSGGEVLFDHH